MTDRRVFVLSHPEARRRAMAYVAEASDGMVVEVKPQTRNLDQNAALWACLADIAAQVVWHGQKLSSEDWKHILSASLRKSRVAPGIDGGFVVLGQSTSRMSKAEFSELLELAHAFGTEHGVMWAERMEMA